MVNARSKGARGEREFCNWLKDALDLSFLPTRNLEQVRSGGADVLDIPPFIFEVKRVEKPNKRKWWLQVKAACQSGDVPVVAYRKNRQPWRFLISAAVIGLEHGFIQLEEMEFKQWIKQFIGKGAVAYDVTE